MKRFSLLLLCLLIVGAACNSSDDDSTATGQETIAATNQSVEGCLGEAMALDDDSCETALNLEWDGETLAVAHLCVTRNCGLEFAADYLVEGDTLTVYERNENDLVALCDCLFNIAYEIEPTPGDYRFVLYHTDVQGNQSLMYEESISLPAGEARSYTF